MVIRFGWHQVSDCAKWRGAYDRFAVVQKQLSVSARTVQ